MSTETHSTALIQPSPESISSPTPQMPIVLNHDGSVTRIGFSNVAADPSSTSPVLTKDVTLNQQHHTWTRLFLPRTALDTSPTKKKPPIIVYFHGGGFVLCSAADSFFHKYCSDLALRVPAIVASVEYRLAPEHRLPAAYDDAVDALRWIRTSTDEWISEFADLSNCYLMGLSAGANIAYHGGLMAAETIHELAPLQIRGLILSQPYFGGSERTPSELLVKDEYLSLSLSDLMWDLALPAGSDRDHKYANPTVDEHSPDLIRSLDWTVVVTGCGGDPLIDRQRELAKVLIEKGVKVVSLFDEIGIHGSDMHDKGRTERVFHEIIKLVAAPLSNL